MMLRALLGLVSTGAPQETTDEMIAKAEARLGDMSEKLNQISSFGAR